MVYLLQKFFGRDGREEAGALLERTSGDANNPRILGAFNEKTPDWLAFFMFTYFTDRDGKFQLAALAESAFDPLARTTKFMLTEEAHHMFVGESGVSRVLQRTAQVMNELKTDDPALVRAAGAIDLGTIQRYLNFHYSVTIDLFGADQSSNAATFYSSGLKGRFEEGKRSDDHVLKGQTYKVLEVRTASSREGSADAQRPERGAARRLHQGLDRRHRPLEQGAREGRPDAAPRRSAQGVQPQDRRARRHQDVARRPRRERRGVEGEGERVAAEPGRLRVRRLADGAGARARQVRRLDRAAGDGDQQEPGRLRIRAIWLIIREWRRPPTTRESSSST
jgi:hypothetical protein